MPDRRLAADLVEHANHLGQIAIAFAGQAAPPHGLVEHVAVGLGGASLS
jgi:hypothetical protein